MVIDYSSEEKFYKWIKTNRTLWEASIKEHSLSCSILQRKLKSSSDSLAYSKYSVLRKSTETQFRSSTQWNTSYTFQVKLNHFKLKGWNSNKLKWGSSKEQATILPVRTRINLTSPIQTHKYIYHCEQSEKDNNNTW